MLVRTVLLLACAAALVAAPARAAAQTDVLFEFHSNPWLNLHHILWAGGKPAPPPADMPDHDRSAWYEGIASYAPYAKRDLFDEELLKIKEALRTVETNTNLEGVAIDAGVTATLERLMPIDPAYYEVDPADAAPGQERERSRTQPFPTCSKISP